MRKILHALVVVILALVMPSVAAAQGPDDPHGPRERTTMDLPRGHTFTPAGVTVGPGTTATSWSDSFDDDIGFTFMGNAAVTGGDVVLSQIAPKGYPAMGGSILAMTVGPDGKIYLGTSGAYLNVYDPATGSTISLGAPVPDECSY